LFELAGYKILIVSERHASYNFFACFQEKDCLKLKKDRGKKEDQPKFVSSENEEDNARAKRSKSVEK